VFADNRALIRDCITLKSLTENLNSNAVLRAHLTTHALNMHISLVCALSTCIEIKRFLHKGLAMLFINTKEASGRNI
jgi:hypothetical protein